MLFYLTDSNPPDSKFHRDEVSLRFVLFLIISVSVLQIFIEHKKRKLQINARKAEMAAEMAHRNLEEARMKLNNRTVVGQLSNPDLPNRASQSVTNNADLEEKNNKNNALKFARAIALFAVLPTSLFVLLFSLESIQDWRPHGVSALVMSTIGIVVPTVIFIENTKLRNFSINYMKSKFSNFGAIFKSPRVQPVIPQVNL